MHLIMIVLIFAFAWLVRTIDLPKTGNWTNRTYQTLLLFLLPPLLLLTTAFAVLFMGYSGQMFGLQTGWFSYLLALSFLGFSGFKFCQLLNEGLHTVNQIRTYPVQKLKGENCRLFDTDFPYSALIGFWQPELVVSQGLLDSLTPEQLDAVIAHEQAHYYYRDTFWFFWLGWLRSIAFWLPNTEKLWQELLILRELRADHWAAKIVDPLTLAESLLLVVSQPIIPLTNFAVEFSAVAPLNRLNERIEALLTTDQIKYQINWWSWSWLILVLLPLAAVPLHN
ncbi:Zn-dependent protease with chaperone function [[Phormidium ambiguum] IAM M-71]|uniref:Zn-dependent protease with chaperone function n=1 Tax=[Phormidium ambiguum] IAM M-71 TaxID=454136 RepID=A0A1U7IRJ9_9CYAN|nr:M56 family metallopeptidase [Phormidium ambiguum]OKH40026.1 Zn-dependent protease with chaperone function [Phormidium ambiguum IAM M-71]